MRNEFCQLITFAVTVTERKSKNKKKNGQYPIGIILAYIT